MKVVIVGAGGYLGTVLVTTLRKSGIETINLDLGLFGDEFKVFDYIKADAYTYDVEKLFKESDAVVHLAGVSNDPASEIDPELTLDMNLNLTKKLVDYAKFIPSRKFIFASSASVYGCNPDFVDENAKLNPQSLYATTKMISEAYIYISSLNYTILRFGTLFGPSPKMRFDLAINLMIKTALLDGKISVYGGNQWRPFLFTEDAANAIKYILLNDRYGIYNLFTDNIKISSLATKICDEINCEVEYEGILDNRDYKMKTIKDLGFRPSVSLGRGVTLTTKHIRNMIKDHVNLDRDEFYTLRMWRKYLDGSI